MWLSSVENRKALSMSSELVKFGNDVVPRLVGKNLKRGKEQLIIFL